MQATRKNLCLIFLWKLIHSEPCFASIAFFSARQSKKEQTLEGLEDQVSRQKKQIERLKLELEDEAAQNHKDLKQMLEVREAFILICFLRFTTSYICGTVPRTNLMFVLSCRN